MSQFSRRFRPDFEKPEPDKDKKDRTIENEVPHHNNPDEKVNQPSLAAQDC
jgi:hypothetical protein